VNAVIKSLTGWLRGNKSQAHSGRDSPDTPRRTVKGGVLAALRRSPLLGAELDLKRSVEHGRKTELSLIKTAGSVP
jgi:hypothetical protein